MIGLRDLQDLAEPLDYTDIFPFFFIIYSLYYFSDIFLTLII